MYPNWLHVEYAIVFLISCCTIAAVAAKILVKLPINAINSKILGEYSKITEQRIIKKTPAVTIVAAWISAETGVGPSIASGNHVCKPNCADLPTAATNKKHAIKLKMLNS
jgi:hypothetical protein